MDKAMQRLAAAISNVLGAATPLAIFLGIVFVCVLAAGQAVAGTISAGFGPKLIQEDVRIPSPDGRYAIAATILRPEGEGPFGAVILNHGVPGSAQERRRESASDDFNASAPVFARRGYVVVMPMRRGFGDTGGPFAEDAGPCRNPHYMSAESNAADDVMIAYNYTRRLPYVDGSRMILAGQSAGGIVSMFTAATRQPEGLVAVLGFAAGRGGNPDIRPGVPCAVEPVAKVFDLIGSKIQVPVLFHYAENDHYFNPATSKLWYERFIEAGAKGDYVMEPAFGKDGHYVFAEMVGVRYWLPAVEGFFAKYHVPFKRMDAPKPLFASLPQTENASCRSLYRAFLEAPAPRAYAVSGDGRCGFAGAVPNASEAALRECRSVSGAACALYAVDSEVVWKAPETEVKQAAAKPAGGASTGSAKQQ